jgi:amidohydrolase
MLTELHDQAQALLPDMIACRRDLHRHPEIGFQEVRTSRIVAETLTGLGLEIRTGVGKTGVIGLLEGDQPGPVTLLRFDMDALPVEEQNAVDYKSQTAGVMHACGHDGHVSIGLAVAKLLIARRRDLPGTVKFVFQPAEEGLGGARAMVADGALEAPAPDRAYGLHLWTPIPLGQVTAAAGPVMSAADIFTIRLHGRGGHAASPFEARDPMVAAAHIITALQTIPARNVSALDAAVISVTTLKGGEAFNVIPDDVEMRGTVRTFRPAVRERVIERFRAVVAGVAAALEVSAEVDYVSGTKAVINDSALAAGVRALASRLPGVTTVSDAGQTMGAEDMSEFMTGVPGCYFFVGARNEAEGITFPHHHPRFNYDERAMVTGAALMAAVALGANAMGASAQGR